MPGLDKDGNLTGSPPRVRSRHTEETHARADDGITSACAEQTLTPSIARCAKRDHLRVCGADRGYFESYVAEWGSPPRVRSRLCQRRGLPAVGGITSACAEQTQ